MCRFRLATKLAHLKPESPGSLVTGELRVARIAGSPQFEPAGQNRF